MGISQHTLGLTLPLRPTSAGAATLGAAFASTLLTADGPAQGVIWPICFLQTGTMDATANIDRIMSFYQAIVDNAEFTGSSLVLGSSAWKTATSA